MSTIYLLDFPENFKPEGDMKKLETFTNLEIKEDDVFMGYSFTSPLAIRLKYYQIPSENLVIVAKTKKDLHSSNSWWSLPSSVFWLVFCCQQYSKLVKLLVAVHAEIKSNNKVWLFTIMLTSMQNVVITFCQVLLAKIALEHRWLRL